MRFVNEAVVLPSSRKPTGGLQRLEVHGALQNCSRITVVFTEGNGSGGLYPTDFAPMSAWPTHGIVRRKADDDSEKSSLSSRYNEHQ